LQQNGLLLVESSLSCRFGEVDLVMKDGAVLVYVEVRLRGSSILGVLPPASPQRSKARLSRLPNFFAGYEGAATLQF
jgi:putative endonuclease